MRFPRSITDVYRSAARLHSVLPYYLSPWGRAFPAWHYFFEVTRRCNLRCAMCQYLEWFARHSPEEQARGELTTEEWRGVIDQVGRLGLITFTGGEPLLRGDFLDILEYASRKRRTHFITNATRFDEEVARRCVSLAPKWPGGGGLSFIGLSLYGPKEIHNRIVGREEAYDQVLGAVRALDGLRRASGKRLPYIHVTSVIQEANLATLHELPILLKEAGADVFNLAVEIRLHDLEGLGHRDPGALDMAALKRPRLDTVRLAECLDSTQMTARAAGIELRLPRMPRDTLLHYYAGDFPMAQLFCLSPWTNIYVGADGGVYPCFIHRVGDVRAEALRRIWNGSAFRAFRCRLRKRGPFPVCAGCCEIEG